jgi:hypothetical protein
VKAFRLLAAPAAAAVLLATPGIAQAATIIQPFQADSGDSCPYGVTQGALAWQVGPVSPLPAPARVTVTGTVTDKPTLTGPALCRDDGYNTTATFAAYAGTVEVDRQSRTANNATVSFQFNLNAPTSAKSVLDRVVVQVCRSPLVTLPPTYCGKPVTYPAPPIA